MLTFAIHVTKQTGYRLAEVGELLGLIGGAALLIGGLMPFGKRMGQIVAGLAIGAGFALLIVATRWGHFH